MEKNAQKNYLSLLFFNIMTDEQPYCQMVLSVFRAYFHGKEMTFLTCLCAILLHTSLECLSLEIVN